MKKQLFNALILLLLWSTAAIAQQSSHHRLEVNPEAMYALSPEESLKREKAATSEQLGIDPTMVSEFIDFQHAFGKISDRMIDTYESSISAIWMEPMPTKIGVIQFVGDAPQEAFELVQSSKMGDAQIVILEGGLYTYDQHVERAEQSAFALTELGYQTHMTWYDPMIDKITLEMKLEQNKRKPNLADLAVAVQTRLDDRAAFSGKRLGVISSEDFNLEILDPDTPDYTYEDPEAYGGMYVGGGGWGCTAAFTIVRPGGTKGVLTAGHCAGISQIHSYTGVHSLYLQRDLHNNTDKQDAEWHTSNARLLPRFKSDSCCYNLQTGWKTTASMYGNYVCRYGQSTNFLSCGHRISATGVTSTSYGVTITKLARAENSTSSGGDSGGPYFSVGTAYGIHSGSNGITTIFTQIQATKNKIGFEILTY